MVFKPPLTVGFGSPGCRSRTSLIGTDLRWAVSADAALSEKSPYLGGARVRCVCSGNPRCGPMSLLVRSASQSDQPPSSILLRGRDRSPSGPSLGYWKGEWRSFSCSRTRRFRRNRPTSEACGWGVFVAGIRDVAR